MICLPLHNHFQSTVIFCINTLLSFIICHLKNYTICFKTIYQICQSYKIKSCQLPIELAIVFIRDNIVQTKILISPNFQSMECTVIRTNIYISIPSEIYSIIILNFFDKLIHRFQLFNIFSNTA